MSAAIFRPSWILVSLLLSLCAVSAQAQDWPARPVKLVVPYAAGQGTDVAGRYVAELIARELGANIETFRD